MSKFDKLASTWDSNPINIERSKVFFDEIVKNIKLLNNWSVLEYGCGTGTLSSFIRPFVNDIVLVDDSTEMLKVVDEKIKTNNFDNMQTLKSDFLIDIYQKKHNFIYTTMALHHIKDTKTIIERFFDILDNDGYLAIVDLVNEDGSFHSHIKDFDGHRGFRLDELKNILLEKGFIDIKTDIIYSIQKQNEDEIKTYPIFLMIAKKS